MGRGEGLQGGAPSSTRRGSAVDRGGSRDVVRPGPLPAKPRRGVRPACQADGGRGAVTEAAKLRSRGKVRDIYDAGDERLLLVATDRISAFDVVLPNPIPDKGRVLCGLSLFWFGKAGDVVGSPLLSADRQDFPEPFRGGRSLAGRPMLGALG